MISTAKEYYENLYRIQDANPPSLAVLLPSSERIYNIDLNTRNVETPEFLSMEFDHKAETIYFIVDRFYDHVDLSTTVGLVQFENALGDGYIYLIPFYDIETYAKDDKMLFPWCIDGSATMAAGKIKYSIRFFKVDIDKSRLSYNMGTKTVTSKILYGMDIIEGNEEYIYPADTVEEIFEKIDQISRQDIYWLKL